MRIGGALWALVAMSAGSGCALRGGNAALLSHWQAREDAKMAAPKPKEGKLVQAAFVSARPGADEIELVLDRNLDPLTVHREAFVVVGSSGRVFRVHRAVLSGKAGNQSRVRLRGDFGRSQPFVARSVAVLPGMYGADGVPIAAGAATIGAKIQDDGKERR